MKMLLEGMYLAVIVFNDFCWKENTLSNLLP